MNYKILILILLFLSSCTVNNVNKDFENEDVISKIYSNKGFALLYNAELKKRKLVNKKIDKNIKYLNFIFKFIF